MDLLRREHFDPRLYELIKDIDLQQLSRIPSKRLRDTALPNIGMIELVSPEAFQSDYEGLFVSMFHGGERERPELIVQRLRDEFGGRREGLNPYRVVGIRDPNGEAVGGVQFSSFMLDGCPYTVPYVQYIYIRTQNRRQDLSEVLHTMVLAIATADAHSNGQGRTVPFTLFETEPSGHGVSHGDRETATERIKIHTKSGSQAVMLRAGKQDSEPGAIYSAHIQPGLEIGESPITLIWAIRPSPAVQTLYEINEVGRSLVATYYRSFREEKFPEQNIVIAERMAKKRMCGRDFVLMSLADVTAEMYQNLKDDEEP